MFTGQKRSDTQAKRKDQNPKYEDANGFIFNWKG